jgi:thiol-disulfide isomerase/thioredoxin
MSSIFTSPISLRIKSIALMLAMIAGVFVSCGPETEPTNPGSGSMTIPVSGISLNKSSLKLYIGDSASLTATVEPNVATDKNVTWSTSDPSVATVNGGTVTGIAEGSATITATAGDKSTICKVTVKIDQEPMIRTALMTFYNALDGPNWNTSKKWDLSKPLSEWEGITWNKETDELELTLSSGDFGLKGEIPDCFDDLTSLTKFSIQNEPGVTGTLPPSFAKLKNLKRLTLTRTSMTSLPDYFTDMPLEVFYINGNELMTGPIPASPADSPYLTLYMCQGDSFTGTVPDSFAKLGSKLVLRSATLDGRVPDSFVSSQYARYLVNMYLEFAEFRTTPIEVGDYDIPAFWPDYDLKDLVTGKTIPFKDIYSKNKVTILLNWGTWCPHSAVLMPILERMYDKYHDEGLEIIAGFNAESSQQQQPGLLKNILLERGYDKWYNFSLWDFQGDDGWSIWCAGGTPSAILVDNKGNIITSSLPNVSDPARNRFGYTASTRLIPVLESIFGPLDDDNYSSTDYSQDGDVITVQKATVGKGIDLVIMGDAYTDKDIASGLYVEKMRFCAEEIFKIEPFKSFKDRFNIYIVKVVSKNGKTGPGCTTALGAEMYNGAAVTGNADKVYQYALKVPGISKKDNLTIAVMVNSYYAGGIADMNETYQSGIGYFSSLGNDWTAFGSVARHEVGGHAFGFLGDEYGTSNESPSQAMINEMNRKYNQYGWFANLDFTNDPTKVKWADFLSDSRYKDEVGIFEGGNNLRNGVYRPSENSMMNQNVEYFNAPSRWAIYKRIMELSGETPSFSKFLEYDAINRSAAAAATSLAPSTRLGDEWVPDSPPVISR